MLPQRGTVVSIVSFVRGIFKTWEGGLGGKERGKWGCFRQCLEELDLQLGSGTGFSHLGKGHIGRVRSSRGCLWESRRNRSHWEDIW